MGCGGSKDEVQFDFGTAKSTKNLNASPHRTPTLPVNSNRTPGGARLPVKPNSPPRHQQVETAAPPSAMGHRISPKQNKPHYIAPAANVGAPPMPNHHQHHAHTSKSPKPSHAHKPFQPPPSTNYFSPESTAHKQAFVPPPSINKMSPKTTRSRHHGGRHGEGRHGERPGYGEPRTSAGTMAPLIPHRHQTLDEPDKTFDQVYDRGAKVC